VGGVTDYANCDAVHRVFKYGVARSKRAATRTYRNGHYRPAVRPLVYKVNNESDADNDGTACEVSRRCRSSGESHSGSVGALD
jgi:hypothetical protein